jgi:CHAD domain-containing protein
MICLNKYRSSVLKETNRNLGVFLDKHDAEPAHEFRVGVKRLTALYVFLNEIKPELEVRKLLKPYRSLFKPIGKIREGHTAIQLLEGLDGVEIRDSGIAIKAINSRTRNEYRVFQSNYTSRANKPIRIPTIRSLDISDRSILQHKTTYLESLQSQFTIVPRRLNTDQWHHKRILLKRYHHTLDAFQYCPGQNSNEDELKRIKMLEQLLGDWHDRVTTIQLLHSFPELERQTSAVKSVLQKQSAVLLGSAKIYLHKYSRWISFRN